MEADRSVLKAAANEPDAEMAARREFGNVLRSQEQFYESGRWRWLDHLRRDVVYALRVSQKKPRIYCSGGQFPWRWASA